MAIAAPPINPTLMPVGVRASDDMGIYARAKAMIKPDAIAHVRENIQDTSEKNPLLSYRPEFTDGQIAIAIMAATERYNAIPPVAAITTVTPSVGMPFDIFLGLTSAELFRTSYISRLRNEVAYSDSGVSVDQFKSDKYLNAIERWRTTYVEDARRFKISRNTQTLGSTVFSNYMFLYLV